MTYALIQKNSGGDCLNKVMDALLKLYTSIRIKIQYMRVVLPLFRSLKRLSAASFF